MLRVLLLIALAAGSASAARPDSTLFHHPESVAYHAASGRYFVSNFGDGSIVQIDDRGHASVFDSTLTRIAGLRVHGDRLYAASNEVPYKGLVGWDLRTDERALTVPIPESNLLNDLATDGRGFMFITDYWTTGLYRVDLAVGTYELFLDEGINEPNGIVYDAVNDRLIMTSHDPGAALHAVDPVTGELSVAGTPRLYGLDGLAFGADGRLYVSSWQTNAVHRLPADLNGPGEIVTTGHAGPADISIDLVNGVLCVPNYYTHAVEFLPTFAPDLVRIAGGPFTMGNPYDTADPDETHLHAVRLDPYLAGRCEVSVGQFRAFVEATGYVTGAETLGNGAVLIDGKSAKPGDGSWRKPYFPQDDDHPAVCVSWWDAVAYCNWRSESEGLVPCYAMDADSVVTWDRAADGYRLLTEAEWEYAARSRGRDVRYAWGDSIPLINGRPAVNTRDEALHRARGVKNYWEGYDDGYVETAPVAAMAPNAVGLHGLSGNVYEWCWDHYSETYYEESPVDNPAGPETGELRACRDAGFGCPIYQGVVTSRGKGRQDLAFSWGGFRVGRSAP